MQRVVKAGSKNITELSDYKKNKQNNRDYTSIIPIRVLTREQMISTSKKKRKEE